ncbi:MAG: hypothetical protein OXS29_09930 [bacterium]|nr:hypothetical protein [bacterium]MDE0288735.1 hypothetical protein [bacterium]MDE0437256.1 hypothetical protein [bacterium]
MNALDITPEALPSDHRTEAVKALVEYLNAGGVILRYVRSPYRHIVADRLEQAERTMRLYDAARDACDVFLRVATSYVAACQEELRLADLIEVRLDLLRYPYTKAYEYSNSMVEDFGTATEHYLFAKGVAFAALKKFLRVDLDNRVEKEHLKRKPGVAKFDSDFAMTAIRLREAYRVLFCMYDAESRILALGCEKVDEMLVMQREVERDRIVGLIA